MPFLFPDPVCFNQSHTIAFAIQRSLQIKEMIVFLPHLTTQFSKTFPTQNNFGQHSSFYFACQLSTATMVRHASVLLLLRLLSALSACFAWTHGHSLALPLTLFASFCPRRLAELPTTNARQSLLMKRNVNLPESAP